jgi:hypothetical protein
MLPGRNLLLSLHCLRLPFSSMKLIIRGLKCRGPPESFEVNEISFDGEAQFRCSIRACSLSKYERAHPTI